MKRSRLLCLAVLAAALPLAAQAQHDPGAGKPPVVDLKPPPDSATPQAAGTPSPNDRPSAAEAPMSDASMDADGDGKLSREEFMRHQDGVYERMPKGADGQVDLREVHSGGGAGAR